MLKIVHGVGSGEQSVEHLGIALTQHLLCQCDKLGISRPGHFPHGVDDRNGHDVIGAEIQGDEIRIVDGIQIFFADKIIGTMVPVRFRGRRVIVDGSVFLDGVVVHQTVTEQIFVSFIGRIQNAADLGGAGTGITQRIERGCAHGFCDDGVVGLIHRTHAHVSEVVFRTE